MSKLPKGYVQVYTGDGKGKTTVAIGLAVRAAGAGLQVRIVQFMKGQVYSELKALERFSNCIEIHQTGGTKCIRKDEITEKDRQEALRGLDVARRFLQDSSVDLLILDEILVAHWFDLVSRDDVLSLIEEKPDTMELILTGRKAPQAVIDRADLVTDMQEIKHYYQKGISARKGIES